MITVVTALIERDGKVLLQRRADYRQFGGLLETPGGKVNPGEMSEMALVRELHEELGVVVTVHELVHRCVFEGYETPFEVLFYRTYLPENQVPQIREDATDLQWTELSKVKDWDCTPSLTSYIEAHVKA